MKLNSFLSKIKFAAAAAVIGLAALSSFGQGVTTIKPAPRDFIVPIPALVITNQAGAGATNVTPLANGIKWIDVVPGSILAAQSTISSSTTNSGNCNLQFVFSNDGINADTNAPDAAATIAFIANLATTPRTKVVSVYTNAPYRYVALVGLGNTQAAGTASITNTILIFAPAF